MSHRRSSFAVVLAASLVAVAPFTSVGAQLRVVTSTTDLHDIARSVGGNRITATHISEGYQDPHFVEAKPSFILQLRRADVWAYVGLDLEIGWMQLLLDGARNSKVRAGAPGHVDVSRAIPVLDVPTGNVDRSQGDVHPRGNPHYWLDPQNGRRIAELFRDRFSQLDPAGATTYAANTRAFAARLDSAAEAWADERAAINGKPVVAWHTSWRYFAQYSGMSIVGFMEPKPGVPPSPSQLANVIETMKRTGAKVIVMEPFYDRRTADFVAARTDATVLVLPPSVGGNKDVGDYISLLGSNLAKLAAAVR
jgi:ABC-type Zn uptake system ZnuABC Zn-binding protein ZnuA